MAKTPSLLLTALLPRRERRSIWRLCWLCCKSLFFFRTYFPPISVSVVLTQYVSATQSTPPSASSSSTVNTHALNNANGSARRNALLFSNVGRIMRKKVSLLLRLLLLLPKGKKILREMRRLCWSRGLRLCRAGEKRLPGNRSSGVWDLGVGIDMIGTIGDLSLVESLERFHQGWMSGNFGSLRSGVWGTNLVMARFSSKSLLHECWSTDGSSDIALY
jgi:hypothetical protein